MTKKAGKKKRVFIILMAVVLVAMSALFAVLYHNYTNEICVMEVVEHMGQREGVSMNGILVEIEYSVIENGEDVNNYLYVFENGDVYSGSNIDYHHAHQEQWEREEYLYYMDDRYWDYLYEQCYWGRLSPRDLNGIINELAQAEVVPYHEPIDAQPVPATSIGLRKGMRTGTQISTQIVTQRESQAERTYDQENKDIYDGHRYRGRMECDGTEGLEWISWGGVNVLFTYLDNEHAHNAIDIVKSTWAYEQWTNQIFGEGWEERIDLKDELKGMER